MSHTNDPADDLLSAAEAQEILAPHLPAFREFMDTAVGMWRDFETRVPDLRRGLSNYTRARFIYDHIARQIRDGLQNHPEMHPGVTLLEERGLLLLGIDSVLLVRFKKLRKKDLRSGNYPTRRQIDYYAQQDLPGIPKAVRVTAGYVLDPTGSCIAEFEITCSVGIDRDPIWHFPIPNEQVVQHPAAQELPSQTRTRVKAKKRG
jgi:hypothetical protein